MDRLLRGVRRFQTQIFPKRRKLFERLAAGQSPLALFITCADSRIVPNLITQTHPGELFVERNPGALVPLYGTDIGGVSASVEYAVSVLNIPRIVICGHSDCGVMKALLNPDSVAELPAVRHWLRHAKHPASESTPEELGRANVAFQVQNLLTHPSVARRMEAGDLAIQGWFYDIQRGEVSIEASAGADTVK